MGLARLERRWFAALFETILPDGVVEGLPGAERLPLDRFLDDFAQAAPPRMMLGARLALWFVVLLAPLLVLRRPRTFLGLTLEDRLSVLRGLRASRFYTVRELPVLLKSVACLGYCGSPIVQRRIGIAVSDAEAPAWTRGPERP
jgi:hypothetical protein